MLLTIHAPEIESRLQREAARQGVSPEEYARHLLEQHLSDHTEEASVEAPPSPSLYTNADARQWVQAFDAWVNSHERREPLPAEAFERASFYEERD